MPHSAANRNQVDGCLVVVITYEIHVMLWLVDCRSSAVSANATSTAEGTHDAYHDQDDDTQNHYYGSHYGVDKVFSC